jgi:alpha-beta hydrolase superfamily lysophospholipase
MSFRKEAVSFLSAGDRIAGVLFTPFSDVPVPALVLCHGALDFKENYFPLCEYLTGRGMAALAMDMHGHGSSGGRRLHVTISDWVSDIKTAIDFLENRSGINPASIGVFGLSSGGTAALEAAVVEKRIKAVITLDATVRNTLPPLEYLAVQVGSAVGWIKRLFTKEDLRLSLVKELRKVDAASDPEVNRKWIENPIVVGMWSAFPLPGAAPSVIVNTIKRVHKITVPTLVIHGEDDKVDPPETAEKLFNALTCVKRLCIVPGNGHLGHMDRNKELVMELTADWALTYLV